jgi:tryptophanyl-tRNA synthetase
MTKTTILTGIKNSGTLHVGSYLGAIKPMVDLQRLHVLNGDSHMNMFIPDLHTLTVPTDYRLLTRHTIDNIKLYIASGFDVTNQHTYLYRQSRIPAHSELCVLLNNFASFGELGRQTQFKDKALKGDDVSVGLFDYPVLMAADILLYNAQYIPVGEDQRQHIELTRDLAIRINNKFGEVFTVPEDMKHQVAFTNQEKALRIMSLANPRNKMSKSVSDPKGTIDLVDTPENARRKIMSAESDTLQSIQYDKANQPGISNLIELYAQFSGTTIADTEEQFKACTRYGDFKAAVADVVCRFLNDIQSKLADISDEQVLSLLEHGESIVATTANETLYRMQHVVGLR